MNHLRLVLFGLSVACLIGCSEADLVEQDRATPDQQTASSVPLPQCDSAIQLPDGFCAEVFHEGVGAGARHLAVRNNGDVYIAKLGKRGGLLALRDTDDDGVADVQKTILKTSGTAVELHQDALYFTTPETVLRFALSKDTLVPSAVPEVIIEGYPDYRQHASKGIAFDSKGSLYVNVGAPSNACQKPSRTAGAPGQDPCPLLETTGGIWRFDDKKLNQNGLTDGTAYATGIRNGLAIAWSAISDKLYVAQHGRDQLNELWPDLFTPEQRADLPAEQLFEVDLGDHFGWPFCYYDHLKKQKLLNPEYGGDGNKTGRCTEFELPVAAYPGHWAPNDMVFYTAGAYPAYYSGGAFIAFHGSWNRAPFEQQGFRIVFQPFADGVASADYQNFALGFAGDGPVRSPGDAVYRPTGLAIDAAGQLWVSDSRQGRIWRISYRGI